MATDKKKLSALERGRQIVEQNCVRCHSIERTGASKLAEAPPLRDLNKRYSVRDLEEPFAEGIVTAHDSMPVFQFDPPDIHALLTYIESLKPKARRK